MLFAIWRYRLHGGLHGITKHVLPAAAEIVDFGAKDDDGFRGEPGFHLWVKVPNPTEEGTPTEERRFLVVPTGEWWDAADYRYVRTCHYAPDSKPHTVWHLLEVVRQ